MESVSQDPSGPQGYRVHLEAFEGPLDLLLHLIRKEEIDIYDIPISRLLGQYLEYLNLAKELDIDLAGEFVEMASELAWIKSKMLLPEQPEEEEIGVDPRADLVAKLLEYQRYKMAARTLLNRPLLGRDVFIRRAPDQEEEREESLVEIDSVSLLFAFQNILKRMPQEQAHEIRQPRQGVAERVLELTERLKGLQQVSFEDLFEGVLTRIVVIVTFLAVLEMAKQGLLRIVQLEGKITVCPLFSNA